MSGLESAKVEKYNMLALKNLFEDKTGALGKVSALENKRPDLAGKLKETGFKVLMHKIKHADDRNK